MKNRIILAANNQGISRADFYNNRWEVRKVIEKLDVRCIAKDKNNSGILYAGTQAHGIYMSEDTGNSWDFLGMKGKPVKSIATDPFSPNRIIAGVKPANIYISDDKGKTWQESDSFRRMPQVLTWFSLAEPPFTAYVLGLDVSPTQEGVIIAGIEFGGVHLSQDGGKTWKGPLKGSIDDCHNIFFHPKNGNYVYQGGGTGSGAAISRDGGFTWEQSKEGLDRHYGWAVAADPEDPETWYASFSISPFKAHSGNDAQALIFRKKKGMPWQKLEGGVPNPFSHMPYSLMTTEKPGFICAGLSNGDIWFSNDYGANWEQLEVNLGAAKTMVMV